MKSLLIPILVFPVLLGAAHMAVITIEEEFVTNKDITHLIDVMKDVTVNMCKIADSLAPVNLPAKYLLPDTESDYLYKVDNIHSYLSELQDFLEQIEDLYEEGDPKELKGFHEEFCVPLKSNIVEARKVFPKRE